MFFTLARTFFGFSSATSDLVSTVATGAFAVLSSVDVTTSGITAGCSITIGSSTLASVTVGASALSSSVSITSSLLAELSTLTLAT